MCKGGFCLALTCPVVYFLAAVCWEQPSGGMGTAESSRKQPDWMELLHRWSPLWNRPECLESTHPTLSSQGKQISVHVEQSHVQIKTQRLPAAVLRRTVLDHWWLLCLIPCQVNSWKLLNDVCLLLVICFGNRPVFTCHSCWRLHWFVVVFIDINPSCLFLKGKNSWNLAVYFHCLLSVSQLTDFCSSICGALGNRSFLKGTDLYHIKENISIL